jgi:pimeloyl-ACP methyl ester carboxylesterase
VLQQLAKAWPQPVQEMTLLVHSMGGLVARSACHQAAEAGHSWLAQLKALVFLGTPHHGAPLERLGSWVDGVLGSNIVTRPFAKIGQVRSAGITDLRHGNVLHADWHDAGRFERGPDARQPVPLPAGVACYTVAATTLAPGRGRWWRCGRRWRARWSATGWCRWKVRWACMRSRSAAWRLRRRTSGSRKA